MINLKFSNLIIFALFIVVNIHAGVTSVVDKEVTPALESNRNVLFYMSYNFTIGHFLPGNGHGGSHSVGIEIKEKHLITFNAQIENRNKVDSDVPNSWDRIDEFSGFGGMGLQYLYSINFNDIFITRFGAIAGLYGIYRDYEYFDEDSTQKLYGGTVLFVGPNVKLELGRKKVFFNIEGTMLLGDAFAVLLGSGISFRL